MTDSILALRNKTILFVEDDETVRSVTKDSLGILFAKVIVAKNGQDGLEKYVDERPDIILTDIQMPIMDGLEFIRRVREGDYNTPIVLFTAHNEQKYLSVAINLMVDGLIVKPAKLESLLETFARCNKKLSVVKQSVIEFGKDVIYHVPTNELYSAGKKVTLGAKELGVLRMLVVSYPNIVTKQALSESVWSGEASSDSAIKNVIARLRAKIGHNYVVASTGIGWRLEL